MYKVVISQQDKEQVRLIRETLLASLNEVFVYIANSGKDTISIVEKEKPDIVFLAIESSDISGIDVAREIIRMQPDINVVFISKYDYFEFARIAMSLGVKDYLLSPVTRTDIVNVTSNLVQKIKMQEEFRMVSRKNDEFIEASKDLLGYGFVYSILFENNMKKDVLEYKKTLNITDRGFWYNIQIDNSKYRMRDNGNDIIRCVSDVLSKSVRYVIGPTISDRILVYVSVDDDDIRFMNEKFTLDLARILKEKIDREFGIKVNIGIGSVKSLDELHISYDESIRCLRNKGDIVKYVGSNDNEQYIKNSILEKRLIESLEIGNDDVRKIFLILLEQYEKMSLQERRISIFELFIVITHKINEMGTCEWQASDSIRLFEELQSMEQDKIDTYARNRFEYLIKSIRMGNTANVSSVVKLAIQYMYEHYNENISLNDISKLVGVSVQYFSKLFKDEMGCNYVDWLNTLRIKRAKELMTTTHLSIKEVGFKVGYNDPNYFSRIFKRYEGIAPTEYVGRKEVS